MIRLTQPVVGGLPLSVDGLVKRYRGANGNAVDGVSFQVGAGEIFGLLGPNGAGKTTTVSVAATRARPTAGTVRIAGVDVARHPSRARRWLGMVTQANTLDRSLSVQENLYFHGRYFGLSRGQAWRRSRELLDWLGLASRRGDQVDRLSGGLAQRVQLARALVHQPRGLFLDEPTAWLDPQSRLALWDRLRELRDRDRVAIVLTTHSMDEAERVCDRVAIIDHGRILICDTPHALKRRVGTQARLRLGLATQPSMALLERLAALPGIERVIPGDQSAEVLAATVDGLLPELVSAVGAGLRDLTVSEPTLESVFISLTGRNLRD